MPRALWKGAISFGLVHIPVALYPASQDESLNFDWLDRRDMAPVGYKRINKKSGKEVTKEDIVKGIKYADGRYAVLTDEEIKAANPRSTQTVELVGFVEQSAIAPAFFEKPYYLGPIQKGEKVYALLREAMKKEKKIGIAHVVISSKQHLAALIPMEDVLILNTLRWASEIRGTSELGLPAAGAKAAGVKDAELAMATQLIRSMDTDWDPREHQDTFREEIMKLVERKVDQGHTTEILKIDPGEEGPRAGAKILDLTELLKKSLAGGKGSRASKAPREAADGEDEVHRARGSVTALAGRKKPAAKPRTARPAAKTAARPRRKRA